MLFDFFKSTLGCFRTHKELWQIDSFFFISLSNNIKGRNNFLLNNGKWLFFLKQSLCKVASPFLSSRNNRLLKLRT